MKKIAFTSIFFTFCLIITGCFVVSSSDSELQSKYDTLKSKYEILKTDYDALKAEYDEIKKTNDKPTNSTDRDTDLSIEESDNSPEESGAGEVLIVDQDGVKIYSRGFSAPPSEYLKGYYLNLRIENNRDDEITIQARDVCANGYVVNDVMFSPTIPAGKKEITYCWILENGVAAVVDDVEEVELKFKAFESSSLEDLFETNTIVIVK